MARKQRTSVARSLHPLEHRDQVSEALPGDEIRQLKACIGDLISIMSLPALWSGRDPWQISSTLLDALVAMLRLDFAYLRLHPICGGAPIDRLQVGKSEGSRAERDAVGRILDAWLTSESRIANFLAPNPLGAGQVAVAADRLGVQGDFGVLLVGSSRSGFPSETERLVLDVGINQAVIGLHEAQRFLEQKQVAEELDRRVAQRTQEVIEREARIRRLVDANVVGIFIWELEGRILEANDAFLRILGYEREDLASGRMRWTELTPPEWLDRDLQQRIPELKMFGSLQPYEKEYFRKDGSKVPVLIGAASFEENENQGVAFVLDLSERKRIEKTLWQTTSAAIAAEERFRNLVNSVEGIVWEADGENFRFTFVSEQAERILGYPASQWLMEPTFWKDHLHPDDRDWALEFCLQATAEKRNHEFEYRMMAADGRAVWLRDLVTVVSGKGSPVRLRGVMVDVTARKRNEEALEEQASLLSLTHDAIFVRDMRGTIQYWNHGAEELYGWRAEEALGQAVHVLLQTGFPLEQRQIDEELMREGRWEGELVHTKKWGTAVVVASRWSLQRDSKGTPIAILEINNDISDRKRAEEERERLHRLEADLARMNRVSMMGELAASLAHEIKQPMAAAATNAGTCLRWLEHNPPEIEEAQETARRMIKDVNRASDIINRLRSLFSKEVQERDWVDVNEIIEEMVVLLRNEANRYAIPIYRNLAGNLPQVKADRVQLQQVLLNLMLNGIEAMKETQGELTVNSSQSGDRVLISVSDTGVGLPAEKLDQIFSAFFTTKPHGTGMGLAITRSIIEAHGGRVWAAVNSGRGATFHFTLPIQGRAVEMSTGHDSRARP